MKNLNELLFDQEVETVCDLEDIKGSLPHLERACGGKPGITGVCGGPPPEDPIPINPNSK